MDWSNSVVTNEGITMLGRLRAGVGIEAVRAAAGTGTVPASALMAQTDLVAKRQDIDLAGMADVPGGKRYQLLIQNTGLEAGYTMNQIGIWCALDGEQPKLFAILQDDQGVAIPSKTDLPEFVLDFYAVVDYSNEGEFSVVVDPAALVSMGTLGALLAEKADLDPETRKLRAEQLPDGVPKGDIDCGTFDDSGPVALHDASPTAHQMMAVDGNAVEAAQTEETLEEHMADPMAHRNIHLDGNMN